MDARYSRDELLKFIDYLGDKGLLKRATASSRKAATNVLLSILTADEANDLRDLNIDELMTRFANLRQGEFKPDSLSVYKSRLTSSLNDFLRWRENPITFRPNLVVKERNSRLSVEKSALHKSVQPPPPDIKPPSSTSKDEVSEIVFPIPLRPGVIVKVVGIPSDLTADEAEKIGKVVLALSGSQEG